MKWIFLMVLIAGCQRNKVDRLPDEEDYVLVEFAAKLEEEEISKGKASSPNP